MVSCQLNIRAHPNLARMRKPSCHYRDYDSDVTSGPRSEAVRNSRSTTVIDAYVDDRLVDAEASRPNSDRPKLRKPETENTERPEAGSG